MQIRTLPRLVALAVLSLSLTAGLVPARSAPPSRTGSLVALSYNVAGLPQGISGSDPATNSSLISPLLNDYDLVLLQENWADPLHDARKTGLLAGVPAVMYHHEVVGQADHPYRSDPAPHPYGAEVRRLPSGPTLISDGLNRLSRAPFGDLTRVMWRQCHGEFHMAGLQALLGATPLGTAFRDVAPDEVEDALEDGAADCGAQKGFSVARTRLAPGVTVDVYNLHADAGSHLRDVAARAANFEQLAAFIAGHSRGRAVILGGDTNLKTDRPDRAEDARVWADFLAATGLTDVCSAVDCGSDDGVIDKFAFRSGKHVEVTPTSHAFERQKFAGSDGEPLSDHDPLAVTFEWARVR